MTSRHHPKGARAMTIDVSLPPSIPDAFRALAQLTVTDPRLVFMTKEINLFIEVLHHQGQRQYFSPYDLKMLIARMTDLEVIGRQTRGQASRPSSRNHHCPRRPRTRNPSPRAAEDHSNQGLSHG